MKEALLLSGGMDSISLLWWRRPIRAYIVNYGQRPFQGELEAADGACEEIRIPLSILSANVESLGAGDLSQNPRAGAGESDWWPFRNQHLATVAAMAAVRDGIDALAIGTVSTDESHLDGSMAFIERLDALLAVQEYGLRFKAPAKHLTTADLIRISGVPAHILRLAHSCHASRFPCGSCRGCAKYARVWHEIA